MSFKKPYSISLKRETINAIKEFVRKKYGSYYGYISRTIEEAILYYLKNPPKTIEEQYEELKKENEALKEELQKLMNNPNFKIFEEYHKAKEELEELQKEVDFLKAKINETENKIEDQTIKENVLQAKQIEENKNNDLPSFLKGNPWIDILKKRSKEKDTIYK